MGLFKKLSGQGDAQQSQCTLRFRASDRGIQSICVDADSVYTLSEGIIKKWAIKDGQPGLTFGRSDNTFLAINKNDIFSGRQEKSAGILRTHENLLLWDKCGNLIRTFDAPSPSLGRTFWDIYKIGTVSSDENYIYCCYRLDFLDEGSGSHSGHIVIMVWDKGGNLVNFLQDESCPDSYFAIDAGHIYCVSRLDTMAVNGLYVYDKANPLSITRTKQIKGLTAHEILIDGRQIYLFKRRHIQALDNSTFTVVWERKNKLLDEISRVFVDEHYLYVLHYGLKHKALDVHDKYSGTVLKTIFAEDTITCVTTDDSNIFAGLSNGMVCSWAKR